MEPADIVNMVVGDNTSSEISDLIKGVLYSKAGEKVDALKPDVAAGLFGDNPPASEVEPEVEVEAEVETEVEPESQEEEWAPRNQLNKFKTLAG